MLSRIADSRYCGCCQYGEANLYTQDGQRFVLPEEYEPTQRVPGPCKDLVHI